METFRIRSAAKVNLTLDILNTRADGYHELASVVHTIGWWDELEIGFVDEANSLQCNRAELEGDDNLCVRAVQAWREATGKRFGANIHLFKTIPTGAGLGGGSGNAAAMIHVLNRKFPVDESQMHEIAAKLGADVPLFLQGGAMLMEGIGEKLTPLSPAQGWLLIVKPETSFSTPDIYRAWDAQNLSSTNATPAMRAIWNDSLFQIACKMANDLQTAAESLSPLPRLCCDLLREAGAIGAQMSGSGSACFGLFESEGQARIAQQKVMSFLAKDVLTAQATTFVAPFVESGVELVPKSVRRDVAQ
jgi:4-diphosphocytidyl-2-C-methyl-D-erythritol kinase